MTEAEALAQLVHATRHQGANVLAAAIIMASRRSWTIAQATELATDIYFSQHPAPGSGRYEEWAKTREQRLNKPHDAAG